MNNEQEVEKPKEFTAEEFCGIKSVEKRMWYVVDQLFPGAKHTLEDWVVLVSKHGIVV